MPACLRTAMQFRYQIFALYWLTVAVIAPIIPVTSAGLAEVVYAINAGGDAHVDSLGIRYEKDPLFNKVGTASDFGKQLAIGRVTAQDQYIYQTERYHHSTFGYDLPTTQDGDYVMVLKFCEVYFNAPNMKVFDVVLNGDITIITELDIYDRVGRGVAFDEYIAFNVRDGRLFSRGHESEIRGGKIRIEFLKSFRDNPKINAVVVFKGRLEDIPRLPPLPSEVSDQDEIRSEEIIESRQSGTSGRQRRPSGPKTPDPYAEVDDSSIMLPLFVAIGAFIPVLFCLCKL